MESKFDDVFYDCHSDGEADIEAAYPVDIEAVYPTYIERGSASRLSAGSPSLSKAVRFLRTRSRSRHPRQDVPLSTEDIEASTLSSDVVAPTLTRKIKARPRDIKGGPFSRHNEIATLSRDIKAKNIKTATFSKNVKTATFSRNIEVGTLPSNIKSNTLPRDIETSALSRDIEAGTLHRDIIAGTLSRNIETATLFGNIKATNVPTDIKTITLSRDIEAGTLPRDLKTDTLLMDIEAGTLHRDIEAGTLPRDTKAPVLSMDIKDDTLSTDIKTNTLPRNIETATLPRDIEACTLCRDIESGTLSRDIKNSTLSKDTKSVILPKNIETFTLPKGIESSPFYGDVESATFSRDIGPPFPAESIPAPYINRVVNAPGSDVEELQPGVRDVWKIRETLERVAINAHQLLKNVGGKCNICGGTKQESSAPSTYRYPATLEISTRLYTDKDRVRGVPQNHQWALHGEPVMLKLPIELSPYNGQIQVNIFQPCTGAGDRPRPVPAVGCMADNPLRGAAAVAKAIMQRRSQPKGEKVPKCVRRVRWPDINNARGQLGDFTFN